jgi:hypothetical protein
MLFLDVEQNKNSGGEVVAERVARKTNGKMMC